MIRYEASSGAAARWILIPQIEHARLSGALADTGAAETSPRWSPPTRCCGPSTITTTAGAWDEAPGVNPHDGKPRTFTEMEPADSVAIWTRSIELAADRGPLAAYAVAGHFCALGHRAASNHGQPKSNDIDQFLERFEPHITTWLQAWQVRDPAANTPAAATLPWPICSSSTG